MASPHQKREERNCSGTFSDSVPGRTQQPPERGARGFCPSALLPAEGSGLPLLCFCFGGREKVRLLRPAARRGKSISSNRRPAALPDPIRFFGESQASAPRSSRSTTGIHSLAASVPKRPPLKRPTRDRIDLNIQYPSSGQRAGSRSCPQNAFFPTNKLGKPC